ncbi:MAG TPA: DUF1549 and DUF1553 domain-containing protein [Verrucomicrobiae bacterium]|nr:DUF1549 and DUF1553 domain-containing protein [Verrucomicrobiae bacterium]
MSKSILAVEEHWSFKPLIRPPVPEVRSGGALVRNAIDAFVISRQRDFQLGPSPEADRRTLIRRVYFDLAGLPPTPEEVESFLKDTRPDAYERVVDHLLDSPQLGERWARHWLDVVRFSETHGFEMNNPRPNAWPYRDYVIRAFNEDKPYDRFILEQIAGDQLGVDEATGFLVAGAWDQVKSPDEVLTKNQRADELHDIVSTTASAFLGLTVGCARCHDHKFDPISQKDYYAMKAIFAGVQHGERERHDSAAAEREKQAESMEMDLHRVIEQLIAFEALAQSGPVIDTNHLRAAVHPRMNVERFPPIAATRLRFTISATADGSEPCLDELEVFTAAGTSLSRTNIALASFGTRASASGTYAGSEKHRLEHINDGRYGNSRSWISNERGRGWVELQFPRAVTIDRILWARDREEQFKDRLAVDYKIEVLGEGGDWNLVSSSADRRPYKTGETFAADYETNRLSPEFDRFRVLLEKCDQLNASLKKLRTRAMVYAGRFEEPEPTHRLNRGDPMQPREIVEPGVLSAFVGGAAGGAGICSGFRREGERRLAFARWIASTKNPLTARVIVNRLWQYHFAAGLVSTPSDFGRNGAKPSHPELLDWLASELMSPRLSASAPWSLKHIHRLIATSATYRQSSERRPEGMAADADARLLWCYPSHRLDAEVLRDSILSVAGKLDLRSGGPGWSPFEPNENYVRVYVPKTEFGPGDFRRMVYATAVRQRPEGVFGVFDCPDGGQIAPKRTRSTTPLQALNLLNSGFMMQASEFFAQRLEREVARPELRIKRAYKLAFNREPSEDELDRSVTFINNADLRLFCRALFNANEFAYVF